MLKNINLFSFLVEYDLFIYKKKSGNGLSGKKLRSLDINDVQHNI